MEQIKELEDLLQAFPLWEDRFLQIDATMPEPGSCGLFPAGLEELSRRENVIGGVQLRLRQNFVLRRVFPRGDEGARWLLQFQQWLSQREGDLPAFGGDCVIRAGKGLLAKSRQTGIDVYEVTITVDYTKENNYGEN